MSLQGVASGFSGVSMLAGEGDDDPSWVVTGEAGAPAPKPCLSLTFRDLIDEIQRRLARKGHRWEW